MSSNYHSPKQAAVRLGVSAWTIKAWLRQGKMRGRRKGLGPNGPWVINSKDLAKFEKEKLPYNDEQGFAEREALNGRR